MEMLPGGLELVRKEKKPLTVKITRAEADGPWFEIKVNRLSPEEFRKLSSPLPPGIRPGSKAAKEHDAKFQEKFVVKVIDDWSGLTIPNLETLIPDHEIGGDDAGAWREEGLEIPHADDLAVYLYKTTWSDKFGDLIFAAVKDGVAEEEEEEATKGKS